MLCFGSTSAVFSMIPSSSSSISFLLFLFRERDPSFQPWRQLRVSLRSLALLSICLSSIPSSSTSSAFSIASSTVIVVVHCCIPTVLTRQTTLQVHRRHILAPCLGTETITDWPGPTATTHGVLPLSHSRLHWPFPFRSGVVAFGCVWDDDCKKPIRTVLRNLVFLFSLRTIT